MPLIIAMILSALLNCNLACAERLITESHITYIGSFRVPQDRYGCENWDTCVYSYGGQAAAYDPQGNGGNGSLFMGGNQVYGNVAEMSIPTLVQSSNLADLNVATNLQNFADPVDGHRNEINHDGSVQGGSVFIGGMMKWGSSLIGTVYHYYPGEMQYRTHWKSTTNLSVTNDVTRLWEVGSSGVGRFIAGYMGAIPTEHQAAFGGKALAGQGGGNVLSTTSCGPSIWVFDPDSIGVTDPVPATPLAYYLSPVFLGGGGETDSSVYFNTTSRVTGLAFPSGSDSVLIFGRHGDGEICYGEQTADPLLHHEDVPGEPGVWYCYDPDGGGSKGYFAPPYRYRIWAYSVSELMAVKAGTKTPQQAMPYALINLTFPLMHTNGKLASATYDDASRRLYLVQETGEVGQYDVKPIVHVFQIGYPGQSGNSPLNGSGQIPLSGSGTMTLQ